MAGGPNAQKALDLLPAFLALELQDVRVCRVFEPLPDDQALDHLQQTVSDIRRAA